MDKSKMKRLQEKIHNIAIKKGFWDVTCQNCGELIAPKDFATYAMCPYCLESCPTSRNDAEMIALMHSELSEALEDLRQGKEKHVGSELADCVIRVMDFCEARGINLEKEILKKCKKNKKRKYKHGKKF